MILQSFVHSKSSINSQERKIQFQSLKNRHSKHSFLVVGPQNHSFNGILALQFNPIEKKEQNIDGIDDNSQTEVMSQQIGPEYQTIKSIFDIQKPIQKKGPQKIQTMKEYVFLDQQVKKNSQNYITLSLPKYNFDRTVYTPSFLIPDLNYSKDQCKDMFNCKIRESNKNIREEFIMTPRPKTKTQYCAVCRQRYEEYLPHIQGKYHKQKISQSVFTQHIKKLQISVYEEQANIPFDQRSGEKERIFNKLEDQILYKRLEERKKINDYQNMDRSTSKTKVGCLKNPLQSPFSYLKGPKQTEKVVTKQSKKKKQQYKLTQVKIRSRSRETKLTKRKQRKINNFEGQLTTAMKIEKGKQQIRKEKTQFYNN